jgi:hypothetical protein
MQAHGQATASGHIDTACRRSPGQGDAGDMVSLSEAPAVMLAFTNTKRLFFSSTIQTRAFLWVPRYNIGLNSLARTFSNNVATGYTTKEMTRTTIYASLYEATIDIAMHVATSGQGCKSLGFINEHKMVWPVPINLLTNYVSSDNGTWLLTPNFRKTRLRRGDVPV